MKRVFKRVASTVLAVGMAVSLTACGASDKKSESTDNSDPLKVTLCIGRKNDMSFQQSAYEGMLEIQDKFGDQVEVKVIEMSDDMTKWEAGIYDAADSGADIIIGTGYQNLDNFTTIPTEYPDTKFILLDQELDFSANDLPNVMGVMFEANQSGFLAGAVAAYYTTSDKAANKDATIGFVGGMEIITITDFLVGYAEGARYVNPDVAIKTAYVGDFIDTAKGKDLTAAQIGAGADIIFQVAGNAGNGVIEAAAENDGVMAIGVDADQYEVLEDAKLKEAVATSSLKRLDNTLVKIISDYIENPESVSFGSNVTYGMDHEAVGIVFNDKLTDTLGEENVAKVKEIAEKIKSGEITVSKSKELTAEEIKAIVEGTK